MTLSKRILGFLTLIIILGALAAGMYCRLRPDPEAADSSGDSEGSVEVPASASQEFASNVSQPVVGAAAVRDTLWVTVTAAGVAEAHRGALLPARVDGIIREILVEENNAVAAGDLLLQIDTTEYALALARAEANLVGANATFLEMTFGNEDIADPQVREERERIARARSQLAQSEVAVQEAEINLERTSVRAPFPGRIADLQVVEGQSVSPGTELMSVVDLNPIKVEVQVLEAEVGYLSEGRRASVRFAAFPDQVFTGRIATINPVVDPTNRTGRVTILLNNPAGRIKPGMYAEVSIEAQYYPNRIIVPRTAVLERDRRTMLFVYEGDERGGLAKWRYVTTGLESDSLVELVPNEETSMVEPGEIVLVDGHFYLQHDASVTLVESVSPAERGNR
jgi:RND family efflux transporter MFP subunit